MKGVKFCKHCGLKRPNRPRGLCWKCYYTDGVRDLYERGCNVGVNRGTSKEPPTLTKALAGTLEKVEVLVERASLGVSLWHPGDDQTVAVKARECFSLQSSRGSGRRVIRKNIKGC